MFVLLVNLVLVCIIGFVFMSETAQDSSEFVIEFSVS